MQLFSVTKLGGVGFILLGVGGILSHKMTVQEGIGHVAAGLSIIGARNFAQRFLDKLSVK